MKNRILATLSSLTLLAAAAAFAQSGTVMRADIPFEFHVGATIMPAGHYEVRPQLVSSFLLIRCLECKARAVVQTNGVEALKTPDTAKLVFNRYDKTYFLSQVWTPGYSQGRQLRKSEAERELARNATPAQPVTVMLVQR